MPTAAKKAAVVTANPTDAVSRLANVTDRMHGLLMDRADALMGCTENSPEEAELAALTDVIEAYERQRWPDGKIPEARANGHTHHIIGPTSPSTFPIFRSLVRTVDASTDRGRSDRIAHPRAGDANKREGRCASPISRSRDRSPG